MSNTNPLSNQSYINKDFQTIYPELLEVVKKLTYKWDPTISNESDPGVVLIKLNALIADKNNYNIDKNVLECFPDTVSQEGNASKLFSQLGYRMHWYKGATGTISMRWISDPLEVAGIPYSPPIKIFTMVCDEYKETVYTLLQQNALSSKGETVTFNAIQGVVKDYMVGSSSLIKASALDSRNRLYFPIRNVAENGIFIKNASEINGTSNEFNDLGEWEMVENLHTEPLGSKVYQFGIDPTNNSCYIEFPIDITNLIGNGLFVKYIQTNGEEGNVASNRITDFYNDVHITLNGEQVALTTKDIVIGNGSSITNGENPESIDEAYINYKRIVGTFDTLVTLRDYLNYIVNDKFEVVSNGVVADRTTDIQSSYKIVNTFDNTTSIKNITTNDENGAPEMRAFDLKTYFLEYSNFPVLSSDLDVDSFKKSRKESYDKSFNFMLNRYGEKLDTSEDIKALYSDSKSIQHDFIPKLGTTLVDVTKDIRPLFFKNRFDLSMTIIPTMVVTNAQASEIEKNVYDALYTNLQSKNINFGEALTYEQVYDICNKADNRIKAVALDNIEYKTYAVVYNEDNAIPSLDEIEIATSVDKTVPTDLDVGERLAIDILAKNVLMGTTNLYDEDKSFKYDITHISKGTQENVESIDTSTEIEFNDLSTAPDDIESILDNEALYLYAPNLIEKTNYSSGVKYIYYTDEDYGGEYKSQIPANMDITLKKGQYIFMLWKLEDGKDSPYQYAKYGEGTILKSTTKLIKCKDATIVSALNAAGYGGEGQILGPLNDKLYDIDDTILSVTKTVSIKEINMARLADAHNYCYWITNDIEVTDGEKRNRITFKYVEPDDYTTDTLYNGDEVYLYYPSSPDNTTNLKPFTTRELPYGDCLYIFTPVSKGDVAYDEFTEEVDDDPSNPDNWKKQTATNLVDYVVENVARDGLAFESNIEIAPIIEPSPVYSETNRCSDLKYALLQLLLGNVGDLGIYEGTIDNSGTIRGKLNEIIQWYDTMGLDLPKISSGIVTIIWGKLVDHNLLSTKRELSINPLYQAIKNLDTCLSGGASITTLNEKPEIKFGSSAETNSTSTFKYTLKAREYFIYTDETQTNPYILGSGTTIQLIKMNKDITVGADGKPKDIVRTVESMREDVDVFVDGTSAFNSSMWYDFQCDSTKNKDGSITLNDKEMIQVIENQLIILGSGTQIKVMLDRESVGSGTVVDPRYDNLKIDTNGIQVATKVKSGKDLVYVPMSKALHKYTIYYKEDSEQSWVTLAESPDSNLAWESYIVLNLNSGANTPQKLDNTHSQKIVLTVNGEEVATLESSDDVTTYFQTSSTLTLEGGHNVDTTARDEDGNIHYLNFYIYELATIDSTDDYKVEVKNGKYTFTMLKDITSELNIDIPCVLPSSCKHILPVEFVGDGIDGDTTLYFGVDKGSRGGEPGTGDSIITINSVDVVSSEHKINPGIYYFPIELGSNDQLSISLKGFKKDHTFTLNPLFTYNYRSDDEKGFNVEEVVLLSRINKLNVNNTFDYTYQNVVDSEIKNPLLGKEYFQSSHFCNKFTIPQINNISIKTTNKR